MINLVNYTDKYHEEFKSLNLEWLDRYGLTESHDLEVLNDPQGTVIDRGGCLFVAIEEDKVVGTVGLWKESEKEYELIKMTVAPAYRGKGISKLLLDHCLDEARKRNATKVILYSNSQLTTAINLYKKYGFMSVDVTDAPFVTADVKMELILDTK